MPTSRRADQAGEGPGRARGGRRQGDARRKVRESSDRECKQIRDRAQREIDRIEEVWSRFRGLKVQDLEGDELL